MQKRPKASKQLAQKSQTDGDFHFYYYYCLNNTAHNSSADKTDHSKGIKNIWLTEYLLSNSLFTTPEMCYID